MAFSITNFNQQAQDQQMMLIERMRASCPQTASIADNLTTRPSRTGDMFQDDMRDAQNQQGLTAVLGQACFAEAANGGFPPFPGFLR